MLNNGGNGGGGNGFEPFNPTVRELAWFCVRTKPKTEHIAAAHLRNLESVNVFCPRVRFKRPRGQRTMWVTEALFPGYIFAKFNWFSQLKVVNYSMGVTGIVKFGENWPIIDDHIIEDWQAAMGEEELAVCEELPEIGEDILITDGVFSGSIAEVIKVSDSKKRVAVLMDFLGRTLQVELKPDQYSRTDARNKITLKPTDKPGGSDSTRQSA
jgi:transcriptional antiterminator RfaH